MTAALFLLCNQIAMVAARLQLRFTNVHSFFAALQKSFVNRTLLQPEKNSKRAVSWRAATDKQFTQ